MKKHILKIYLFLGLFLALTVNTIAQSTAQYKDRSVRPNSIIVKYDNTEIKAKGKTTTPQQLALTVKNDFNASIKVAFKNLNAEEWDVNGDLSTILKRLNSLPGVKAFPNYVYKREAMTPTMLDESTLGRELKPELHGSDKLKQSIKTKGSFSLSNLESFNPINRIYDEDFDDTTSVNNEWTVFGYENPLVWRLNDNGDGDFVYQVIGDETETLDASTDLVSPQFDLSDLDPSKSYRLRLDYTNGFNGAFIGLYLEDGSGNFTGYDISNFSGWSWRDISSYVGDSLTVYVYVEKLGTLPDEFLFSLENMRIEEYPTDDAYIELQYGLYNDGLFANGAIAGADVSAFDAWQTNKGSDDVVVVVYDDGVDFDHEDLASNGWVNPVEDLNGDGEITSDEWNGVDDDGNGYVDDFWGWSAVYNDNRYVNPGRFHGTHVAGIIGAQGNNGVGVSGVSQDVSIISVMIFDEFGFTDAVSIMRGYDYISSLLESGVEVTAINQSWGGDGSLLYESDVQFVSVMTDYALHHASYEALWVVSAGNSSLNRDDLPFYSYPNNIQSPNIITVASTDWADQLSGFSDYGVRTVDIGAPGSSIISTFPGNSYGYLSGTSMASPHVTGAIALAKAANPTEKGFALAARAFAGSDIQSGFVGVFGEGGRLNANTMADISSEGAESGLIASHNIAFLQRSFIDGAAQKTVGFVNNTNSEVSVSGLTFSGDDAAKFNADFESVAVPAGGAYGVPVTFDDGDNSGEFLATLNIATSGGTVSIDLNGRAQAFGIVEIDPGFADLGPVPYGTELSTSFNILNTGDKEIQYGINQSLFIFDEEFSDQIDALNKVNPANVLSKPKSPADLKAVMDMITAQVMLQRGSTEKQKIIYEPSGKLEDHTEEVIFFDDLDNASVTLEQWELLSFGEGDGAGLNWELFDIDEEEAITQNIFLAGDFETGYVNDFLPVAIPPAFDFTALGTPEKPQSPAYLRFDYAAQLEVGYDFFYINVISNGQRLETLDITDIGTLINDGSTYSAVLDISHLAGIDDIEFWFIVSTDGSFVNGFGAFFDNVEVVVQESPFFTSTPQGSIAPGGSQNIDVTIRTELLPPGDFVLGTTVNSDAFNAFYFGSPEHLTFFESRFANVSISPEVADLGEVGNDDPVTFGFSATNTGALDVDYIADVFLTLNNSSSDFSASFKNVKDEALQRFENADKDAPGSQFNPLKHKGFIMNALKDGKVNPASKAKALPNIRSKFSASLLAEDDIYAEDFEAGELPEGWDVQDFSFGLGNVWSVEEVASNALFVGNPDNFVIFDNTATIAFSPSFDLSTLPLGQSPVLEFDYAFMLEPGYDFGSVWVGVETEDEPLFFFLGSTEDVLNNDGFIYNTRIDLSFFKDFDNVFLTFVVETDFIVQSAFALVDNILVRSVEALAYIDPAAGTIDSAATEEFSVTVNTPQLFPGNYTAISVVDYFSDESFTGRAGFQYTDFNIPNQPPVAVNDTIAVLAGDIIPLNALVNYMLSNDSDEFGQVYLEDFSDPLYGSLKYVSQDIGYVYVAPLNYDGGDVMGYSITDGISSDTAAVLISVRANPEFVKGSDQQYVFLEDNELTLSTVGMAAGVGGQDADIIVWARSHDDELIITHNSEAHTLNLSAVEDYFGQSSATFYVGHEGSPQDSMIVSLIVAPVNDAPVAKLSFENNGGNIQFTDLSTDPKDASDGGIVSWDWNFGDGSSSDVKNPSHKYTEVGTYTVTLKVTDNGGLTAESQEVVNVEIIVSTETNIEIPSSVKLEQNYPNPFNPSTTIKFGLPEAGNVQLEVYNMLGQKIVELVNGRKNAGWHTISFDASQLASGIYIYRITSGNYVKTNKMLLIK
tara:strand:+ start:1409 stop:6949 length:5541 start_codon:yes stop_codon:yes gene_type:complete